MQDGDSSAAIVEDVRRLPKARAFVLDRDLRAAVSEALRRLEGPQT